MKKIRTGMVITIMILILSACGNLDGSSMSSGDDSYSKSTTLTGKAESGDYQGVIQNGHYVTSKSRGVDVSQNDNQYNIKSFENGLLNVSKRVYSPDKYIFREGQILSTSIVKDWLRRKSKSNPTGLNPKNNGSTIPTKRNPIYLQQIDEQDYLITNGKKLKLAGVTIGLGLNSVDYYTKIKFGATYETKISKAEDNRQGKKIANNVLSRLRKRSVMKNIPITIALYRQASNDSLVGGTFFAYSTSKNGDSKMNSWTPINQNNYVYPSASNSTSTGNNNDYGSFENFKNQVQSFFPNLSGVTAQVQYTDKKLTGMNVNITTQFYSQTEIISFTQYLQQAAQKYLPANAPIDILVKSVNGVQSFLSRSTNEKRFTSHVFNSY